MIRIVALSHTVMMVTLKAGKPDESAIRATLARLFPNSSLATLQLYQSTIPRFFRAQLGDENFYITADGKHVLFGEPPEIVNRLVEQVNHIPEQV
jgi:hypothetical protein